MRSHPLFVLALGVLMGSAPAAGEERITLATFQADATPPLGAPLCDGLVLPAEQIVDPLSARGIVLKFGTEQPVVLCAVDWVGIGNTGHDEWRQALAAAAGTTPERVMVHTLHQHDAPGCDPAAEALLAERNLGGKMMHLPHARETIRKTAEALKASLAGSKAVTHVGVGHGLVERVASNRRVLGPDGQVRFTRYSATKSAEVRAEPEGTIDPACRLVAFFAGEQPVAVLTYYATHPQSHYGKGGVSADFPGLARSLREKALPGVPHIHFNGAGGNVTAGKYNDGAPENRAALAERLAQGMKLAWEHALEKKKPLREAELAWKTRDVALPPRAALDKAELLKVLDNPEGAVRERIQAARNLVWLERCRAGHKITLGALQLGDHTLLHLPGELFVEYQLAAQGFRPRGQVCVAAYGDYGAGYIGTRVSYTQGGYETGVVSRVAPEVEEALLQGIQALVK